MSTRSSCKTCAALWRGFATINADERSEADRNFEVEIPGAVDFSQCPNHAALFDGLLSHWGVDPDSEEPGWRRFVFNVMSWGPGVRIDVAPYSMHLSLIKRPEVTDHPGFGRIIDPKQAPVDLAKTWKLRCLESHGTACSNPLKIWTAKPAWVVDTAESRVVPGNLADDYIVLSYRWGNSRPVITSSDVMRRLQEPGSLDDPTIRSLLAPLVSDVLLLTRTLGERFLWIDVLCVDHSDRDATRSQLELMGSIFANAVMTIVVVCPDAQEGLLGLPCTGKPREQTQNLFAWGSETVAETQFPDITDGSGAHSRREYYWRGWTHQEYALSTRRLVIDETGFWWNCSRTVWREDSYADLSPDWLSHAKLEPLLDGFPILDLLASVLSDYNRRKLRYEEDALAGCSGLLLALSRTFSDGFLYGLPIMYLDSALCWKPWTLQELNFSRRIASDRSEEDHFKDSSLPSWSWIGWRGEFCYPKDDDVIDYGFDTSQSLSETIPITEWFAGDSPDTPSAQRRRLKPAWYERRSEYKRSRTGALYPGWTRRPAELASPRTEDDLVKPYDGDSTSEELSRSHPMDGLGDDFFVHHRRPHTRFCYPFPVPQIDESSPSVSMKQAAFLFCETERAALWVHEDVGTFEPRFHLRNGRCMRVGHFTPDCRQDEPRFRANFAKDALGLQISVVAICRVRVLKPKSADYFIDPAEETGDFIRVLWVEEEKNGVSYRQGTGVVSRKDWLALDRETVELVLG